MVVTIFGFIPLLMIPSEIPGDNAINLLAE